MKAIVLAPLSIFMAFAMSVLWYTCINCSLTPASFLSSPLPLLALHSRCDKSQSYAVPRPQGTHQLLHGTDISWSPHGPCDGPVDHQRYSNHPPGSFLHNVHRNTWVHTKWEHWTPNSGNISCELMRYHVRSREVMWAHVVSCEVTWGHVSSCGVNVRSCEIVMSCDLCDVIMLVFVTLISMHCHLGCWEMWFIHCVHRCHMMYTVRTCDVAPFLVYYNGWFSIQYVFPWLGGAVCVLKWPNLHQDHTLPRDVSVQCS